MQLSGESMVFKPGQESPTILWVREIAGGGNWVLKGERVRGGKFKL